MWTYIGILDYFHKLLIHSFIHSIHCWLYRIYYWHIFILQNKTYYNCLVCQSGIMLLCWTATTKFCILIYDTNI